MKRRCCLECGTVIDSGEAMLIRGPLKMDRTLLTVEWRGQPVKMTKQQFEVLEMLVQREGRMVQRWAFFGEIINEDAEDGILDVRICQLRTMLRRVDPDFDQIKTLRGDGYCWQKLAA